MMVDLPFNESLLIKFLLAPDNLWQLVFQPSFSIATGLVCYSIPSMVRGLVCHPILPSYGERSCLSSRPFFSQRIVLLSNPFYGRVGHEWLSFLNLPAGFDQASGGYELPPKEILDIVDAPPTPALSFSPGREKILFLERRSLPPLADLARPELKLAGLRIDASSNTRSRM